MQKSFANLLTSSPPSTTLRYFYKTSQQEANPWCKYQMHWEVRTYQNITIAQSIPRWYSPPDIKVLQFLLPVRSSDRVIKLFAKLYNRKRRGSGRNLFLLITSSSSSSIQYPRSFAILWRILETLPNIQHFCKTYTSQQNFSHLDENIWRQKHRFIALNP